MKEFPEHPCFLVFLFLLSCLLQFPLSAQEEKWEVEDLVVNREALNEDEELLPDLWNIWRNDSRKEIWSGGAVVRSPTVEMDREETDEGAPMLHIRIPVKETGVYTVVVHGPNRPVGVSFDEGETWRCVTQRVLLKNVVLEQGDLDIWFDDRYAAVPPHTLGPTYLDYVLLTRHDPAENGVYNGGFEDTETDDKGRVRGWIWFQRKQEGGIKIVEGGHESGHSLHVATPPGPGRDWAVESVSRLPVSLGEMVEMSAWVKRIGGARTYRLEMVSYAKGERVSWRIACSRRVPRHARPGEWTRIYGYATIGENIDQVSIRLVGAHDAELQLDDVRLVKMKESRPVVPPEVVMHVHVPKGYDANRPGKWRALVLFGGRNNSPKDEITNRLGWADWSDRNGVFLIAPDFDDDEYWSPRDWSGMAFEAAMGKLKGKYNICTDKLLYYGYSEGSQASCLFANWSPDSCRAWVSHACGVFWKPEGENMPEMPPGLVTCGDADRKRYLLGREFVKACRQTGAPVIWKTMHNHGHDVPEASLKLARAFLLHWHSRHLGDLGLKSETVEDEIFIGDDGTEFFYPENSPMVKDIAADDRVELPGRAMAEAWGRPGR